MSSLDLNKLILEYSEKGIRDWNDVSYDLQTKSRRCLANAIVERGDDVERMIGNTQASPQFVPMPKVSRRGFEWCFFLPKMKNGNLTSLILFLLVNRARQNCLAFRFESSGRQDTPHGLAFRFESSGRQDTPHGYPHMQFTRRIAESSSVENFHGVPEWLPDSYPAFPIPAHDPLEMFLCMVTSVHGFRGGIDNLLIDVFRPNDARECIKKLNKMLNPNP